MTTEELKEIRERAEMATPGPWIHVSKFYEIGKVLVHKVELLTPIQTKFSGLGSRKFKKTIADHSLIQDSVFIAHARTDIPRLLDEIERLNSLIKTTGNEIIAELEDHCCGMYRHKDSQCKKRHGYCGFELDHGFDLEDIKGVVSKITSTDGASS